MLLFDHIVVLLFAGLYPAYDFFYASKRFKRNVEANKPGIRLQEYQSSIAGIWILSLLALTSWIVNDRELINFGLTFSIDWTVWLGLALSLLALVYIIYLYHSLKNDSEQVSSIRAKIKDKPTSIYLPRTKNEFRWFILVSISAGICEEILFRGFLMWYISQFGPIIIVVLLSSILFGFAHAYQGWNGILQSGVAGFVLAVIYVFSGSLWIPIALHIVIDIYSGMIGWIGIDESFQKDIT